MKKYFFFGFLFCLNPVIYAQFSPDITSIREEFHKLSVKADRIMKPYDSLLRHQNQLRAELEYESEIYRDCPFAIENELYDLAMDGMRSERKLVEDFLNQRYQKENLQNQISIAIMNFNNWNMALSFDLANIRNQGLLENYDSIELRDSELTRYITKLNKLQAEANKNFARFDSCRNECENQCRCEKYYNNYLKIIGLSEKYMLQYREALSSRNQYLNERIEEYQKYLKEYDSYLSNYRKKKKELEKDIDVHAKSLRDVNEKIVNLTPDVYNLIYSKMNEDIRNFHASKVNEISRIDSIITREFGEFEFYNYLVDMQRRADIMVTTLNPEMNFLNTLSNIESYPLEYLPDDSDGRKMRQISIKYGDILDNLKTAIRNYDAIPYFCLNAYPQYYNELVDENLQIIDRRLALGNDPLEDRTRKFLEISELDLSNSNFSLDLVFKDHENIRKLDLSNTQVNSVRYLTDTKLKWLDLSNTEISREDLEDIKRIESLEYLDLSNTGLNKKDIHNVCFHLKLKRRNCKTE